MIRHEVARALLARAGRAVALDRLPVRNRTRWGHLRNGTGAIVEAGSQLAWRPTLFVWLYYLTRASVQSELGYGFGELGLALRPPESARGRALLVTLPFVAAALVVASRTRRRGEPHPPFGAPAEHEAVSSPPTPVTVGS